MTKLLKRKGFVLPMILVVLTCFIALSACSNENGTLPSALTAPVVTLTADTASWQADANADKFEISIGGALSYLESTVTSKKLADGDTFKVRAVGDGIKFTTSDWSNTVTYTGAATPTALSAPVVTITATGLASWPAVDNASGYKYKIDNGTEQTASGLSVQLTEGQTIVVKAVGNGTTFTDSAYSAVKSYTGAATPTALSAPVVTITATGLASWPAVDNASGYKYKINNGTEQTASGLSVQLTSGQAIVVKAVGNGTSFTDSAYSATKTYTAAQPGITPTYLGIMASNTAPNETGDVPVSFNSSTPRLLTAALSEYYANTANHLNDTMPTASDYTLYSTGGQTVYVQIWLNNPSQYTILSLKLNGTKYQVGGALSSFFKQADNKYYNCVYATVEIPADSDNEISYEVSEIEYIENTFINADGTDTFMNDNDTVVIGLPYEAALPTVSDYQRTGLTVNSYGATFTLSDTDALVATTGGWLRAVIYDDYNVITHHRVIVGENTISATGLEAATDYSFIIYLYADLHDGNGVMAHQLEYSHVRTAEAITVTEISGDIGYNEANRYGAIITVDTTLNSTTAEYVKLEIINENDAVVYTDTEFDGTAEVMDGVLNNALYKVRVYYRDNEYPDGKYVEEAVHISPFSSLHMYDVNVYSLQNDAVIDFRLGNSNNCPPIVDSFIMGIFDEKSAQYIAEYVLRYLDNPTLLDELNNNYEQAHAAFDADPQNVELYQAFEAASAEKSFWEDDIIRVYENKYNSNADRSFWETEMAKGKYYYTFTYEGTDTESFFKVNDRYYAVCDDFYTRDNISMKCKLSVEIDKNEGGGLETITIDNSIYTGNDKFDISGVSIENGSGEDGSLSFDLVNVNVDDQYKYAKLGWVSKITISRSAGETTVYENATMPTMSFIEADWLAAYVAAIKAGEDTGALFMDYVGTYDNTFTTTFSKTGLDGGEYTVYVYTKLFSNEINANPQMTTFTTVIHEQLSAPEITFADGEAVFNGGADVPPEYSYYYEIVDKDNNPVDTNQQSDSAYVPMTDVGNKIRAKAVSNDEYYLDSAWSDWHTFGGNALNKPVLSYSTENGTVVIAPVTNAGSYVYTINDGAETTILSDETLEIAVTNGDIVKVKAVPTAAGVANNYVESDLASFTCTDDRTKLATPEGLRVSDDAAYLEWNAVTNATSYKIEIVGSKGAPSFDTVTATQLAINNGYTYRVQAIGDTNTYLPSAWSTPFTYTEKLAKPAFDSISSGYVKWSYVSNASGYRWKIDDGAVNEVGTATSARRVLLSTMTAGEKLYVQAFDDSAEYADSDWEMIYHHVEQLATPVVTVDNGVATWTAVGNASGYKYKINDGTETATTELTVSGLNIGDVIVVCATRSDGSYTQSEWSTAVTAKTKLSTPVVSISSDGTASWQAVENAVGYVYMLGENGEIGTTETSVSSLSVQLSYNQTIVVKCVGSGNYADSAYSALQEYEDTRPRLSTPVLAYDIDNGLIATITADGMITVEYKCGMIGATQESFFMGTGTSEEIPLDISSGFLDEDRTVYVKLVPEEGSEYRESEWATISIPE